MLAITMCASLTISGFAVSVPNSDLTINETIHPNGDRTWHVIEDGKFSTILIYHDKNYILVDGEKIVIDDEILLTVSQPTVDHTPQLFAAADPVWVYIHSLSYSAKTTKAFNTYTIGTLAALLSTKLGLGYAGNTLVAIATIAITDYANQNVMDTERDVYGNQNNLNHYKYEDSFYIAGDFIDSKIMYNPSIY